MSSAPAAADISHKASGASAVSMIRDYRIYIRRGEQARQSPRILFTLRNSTDLFYTQAKQISAYPRNTITQSIEPVTTMLVNTLTILLAMTLPFSHAACTLTGYSGKDCTGSAGASRELTSSSRCISMGGRQSYRLSSDCDLVRIEKHTNTGCGGDSDSINDLGNGCHGSNLRYNSLIAYTRSR